MGSIHQSCLSRHEVETSKTGIQLITHYEGCSLSSYPDVGGIWTIGYGTTGPDIKEGMTITQCDALSLLSNDLKAFENMLNKRLPNPIKQNEFDALMSFLYNVGPGGRSKDGLFELKLGRPSSLWSYVVGGQMNLAASQFQLWNRVGGVVVHGLSLRRHSEAMLFSTNRLVF
nr:lysozyme [Gluconacetobacter tumulicola]